MIRETKQSAALTFDYICLIIVASVLAGIGLATDNAVSLFEKISRKRKKNSSFSFQIIKLIDNEV